MSPYAILRVLALFFITQAIVRLQPRLINTRRSAGGILADGAMTHMTPHQISAIMHVCKIRHRTRRDRTRRHVIHTPYPILHSNPLSTM